ncbi:hypothetical protein ABBQ32_012333 [Trebouxia sp. C0010 RCD-2024]
MPLHSCALLPCCAPLKHSSSFGRHALHRRQPYSRRHNRRHHSTRIEAKKKGQMKASKRFGHQTFPLNPPSTDDGDSSSYLTDYLKLGRAIGESPVEVEKKLKAKGVAVEWDTQALNYMQEWQDEELRDYAAATAIMSGYAQKAGTQSRATAKLQKLKEKHGVEDSLVELAQQQKAAHDISAKRFRPLTVLKAKKGKAILRATLAQKPYRDSGSGGASKGSGAETWLLSRPKPASQDEVRSA